MTFKGLKPMHPLFLGCGGVVEAHSLFMAIWLPPHTLAAAAAAAEAVDFVALQS